MLPSPAAPRHLPIHSQLDDICSSFDAFFLRASELPLSSLTEEALLASLLDCKGAFLVSKSLFTLFPPSSDTTLSFPTSSILLYLSSLRYFFSVSLRLRLQKKSFSVRLYD
ncbi:hypothetical protein AWENTII_008692 [Aspergillus wentii]